MPPRDADGPLLDSHCRLLADVGQQREKDQQNQEAEDGVCDDCGGELYQRDDDKEDTIRKRIKVYNDETSPLVEYYLSRGCLRKVDGNGSIEGVFMDLCKHLDGVQGK